MTELCAYRLVKRSHTGSAFDGEGASLYGGRWNSPGVSVVYTSESLALCCLEIFVHLPSYNLLHDYDYFRLTFDACLVTVAQPVHGWNARPVSASSQFIGDRWVRDGTSAVLQVPSIVIPDGVNYLLNIIHPDFKEINIGDPMPMAFDRRLRKS